MNIHDDYYAFLRENGLNQEAVDAALRQAVVDDTIPCPKVFVSHSDISGFGMFSNQRILPGEQVAPILLDGKWTTVGRYTNHSPTPNSSAKRVGSGLSIIALSSINVGDEITANYRQVKQEMEGI